MTGSGGRSSIPEAQVIEPKSRGVLDHPPPVRNCALGRVTTVAVRSGPSRVIAMTSMTFVFSNPSTFLLRLRPHLDLAIPLGAALTVVLRAALDGHRVVGHVPGDDRAGADIGAVADFHRRHQRGIGADEGVLANDGLVLEEAIIIASSSSASSARRGRTGRAVMAGVFARRGSRSTGRSAFSRMNTRAAAETRSRTTSVSKAAGR